MLKRLWAWHEARLENSVYFVLSAGVCSWVLLGIAFGFIHLLLNFKG